jgi:hypothetical protein
MVSLPPTRLGEIQLHQNPQNSSDSMDIILQGESNISSWEIHWKLRLFWLGQFLLQMGDVSLRALMAGE